jgi:hypothetical protein
MLASWKIVPRKLANLKATDGQLLQERIVKTRVGIYLWLIRIEELRRALHPKLEFGFR